MEKYLYIILDVFSFLIPFVYSFERKRLHFIQYWKSYFLAIFLVAIPFIIWDSYFTNLGYWGFNERYHLDVRFFSLPLEEWLFFLLIPFASNFIHYALLYFFPKPKLSSKVVFILSFLLCMISAIIANLNMDKAYTFLSFGTFSGIMLLQVVFRFEVLQRYLLSFIIILIPFLIVNSWLTGYFTDEPVVWYNDEENLGIRVGTIPIEDFFYCFTMLYSSLLIFERFNSKAMNSKFIFNNHD